MAPLFLQRDNGINLVNTAVDVVLAEFGAIPLNSPRYYSHHNGSIENGKRELKTWLTRLEAWALPLPVAVRVAQLWINVRVRRCLAGSNAQNVCSYAATSCPGYRDYIIALTARLSPLSAIAPYSNDVLRQVTLLRAIYRLQLRNTSCPTALELAEMRVDHVSRGREIKDPARGRAVSLPAGRQRDNA